MSVGTEGGSGRPSWLFWAAALVCLAGPYAFGTGEDMRGQVRILTKFLSLPFALTSAFLALSTRRPRCGGGALWTAASLWLGSVFFLMVPVCLWAMNRNMVIYVRLADVQGLFLGLASLAFVVLAARTLGRRDGWELPLAVRATHATSVLLLAAYLGRGAMLTWGFDALSAGPGLAGLGWEISLARYAGLVAATLMAVSVGARYVLRGDERRRPTSGCS